MELWLPSRLGHQPSETTGCRRSVSPDIRLCRKNATVEYRNDLARILLDGLPPEERDHALGVIQRTAVDKLDQMRASSAREADRIAVDGARRAAQPPTSEAPPAN